jgi:hypothetical protein
MGRHDQGINRMAGQFGDGRIAIADAGDFPLVAPGMDELGQFGRQCGLIPYKQNMQRSSPAAAQDTAINPITLTKTGEALLGATPVL